MAFDVESSDPRAPAVSTGLHDRNQIGFTELSIAHNGSPSVKPLRILQPATAECVALEKSDGTLPALLISDVIPPGIVRNQQSSQPLADDPFPQDG
jgi:hypothetical protein